MTANALPAELPRVTVQLPLYNEATVARRLIEATGSLDYPKDKLEIQVLDDSTDETVAIARAAVTKLREAGIDAVYVRRPNRVGVQGGRARPRAVAREGRADRDLRRGLPPAARRS